MIPSHQFIKNYNGFDIFLRQPGFESIPTAFGKVAAFIVSNEKKTTALFAFSYSGLEALQNPSITEVDLLKKAVTVIEKFIDNKKIKNNQENTFEYQGLSYKEISNATWWFKTS